MRIELTRPQPADCDIDPESAARVADARRRYLGEHGYAHEAVALPTVVERLADVLNPPPRLADLGGYDFRRAHREAEDPERFDGMG